MVWMTYSYVFLWIYNRIKLFVVCPVRNKRQPRSFVCNIGCPRSIWWLWFHQSGWTIGMCGYHHDPCWFRVGERLHNTMGAFSIQQLNDCGILGVIDMIICVSYQPAKMSNMKTLSQILIWVIGASIFIRLFEKQSYYCVAMSSRPSICPSEFSGPFSTCFKM